MDGISGIYATGDKELAHKIFLATGALQHRGKASAGIAIGNDNGIYIHKDLGRIGDVMDHDLLRTFQHLRPRVAIGNVGYTKNKNPEKNNAEPILIHPKNHSQYEVALTLDGYLVKEDDLKTELEHDYHFETRNKTEVLGALLHKYITKHGPTFDAGKIFIDKLKGKATFSLAALVYDGVETSLISLQDKAGFEPFCYGTVDDAFIVSSESCSHRRLGGSIGDEYDGAFMTICSSRGIDTLRLGDNIMLPDVFQGVYFGNVASLYRGKEIFQLRKELGNALVDHYGIPDADIVIPNPESGWGVTMGIYEGIHDTLAKQALQGGTFNEEIFDRLMRLKTVYPALVKQAQAVRTFQEGAQRQRTTEVGLKFGGIDSLLKDRNVIMGDDSIVKGSVSEGGSVWVVYNAGAHNLEFWVSYGPMFFPSFKEWHRGKESMEELAVQRAFKGDNPYDKSLDEINENVARLIGVNKVRYNKQELIEKVTGPGSFQALDASYPIDEQFWPSWLKMEYEKFKKYN
jgi:amidophosphoribosyltransferase